MLNKVEEYNVVIITHCRFDGSRVQAEKVIGVYKISKRGECILNWYLYVLKKYAVFEGRARRKEYWMFFLFNMIFGMLAGILDTILGLDFSSGNGPIGALYGLAVLIPGIAVMVRRLHDVGRSGWFFWINLIPIIGWVWFLIVLCTEGSLGINKYGPNPKTSEPTEPNLKVADLIGGQKAAPDNTAADAASQIKKLTELKDAGILTEAEFAAKKQELLDKIK
jgi:uncharacterized membrane protein YhaH (DUF805 family)